MLKNLDCNIRAEFKPLSAGLPSMILQNGFGQTLAFLAAKGSDTEKEKVGDTTYKKIKFKKKDKHYIAFNIITCWLKEKEILPATESEKDLLLFVGQTMQQTEYLRAQRETLAMLEWLKRYANAGLFNEEIS
jgi:CRISPR-associated protein Cmr5